MTSSELGKVDLLLEEEQPCLGARACMSGENEEQDQGQSTQFHQSSGPLESFKEAERHLLDLEEPRGKRLHVRGTRGKGDHRNNGMKRAKARAEKQRQREIEREVAKTDAALSALIDPRIDSPGRRVEPSSSGGFQARSNGSMTILNRNIEAQSTPRVTSVADKRDHNMDRQTKPTNQENPPRAVVKLPLSGPASSEPSSNKGKEPVKSPLHKAPRHGKVEPLNKQALSLLTMAGGRDRTGDMSQAERSLVDMTIERFAAGVRDDQLKGRLTGYEETPWRTLTQAMNAAMPNAYSKKMAEEETTLQDNAQTVNALPPTKPIVKIPDVTEGRAGNGSEKYVVAVKELNTNQLPNHPTANRPYPTFDPSKYRCAGKAATRGFPNQQPFPIISSATHWTGKNHQIHSQAAKNRSGVSPSVDNPSLPPSPKMNSYFKPVWAQGDELTIRLFGLPCTVDSRDVWNIVKTLGAERSLSFIEIYENKEKGTNARLLFKPPPSKSFWDVPVKFTLSDGRKGVVTARIDRGRLQQPSTPLREDKKLAEMELDIEQLDFGFLYGPTSMMVMRTIGLARDERVSFTLSPKKRLIDIQFSGLPVSDFVPLTGRVVYAIRHYRFQIRFSQLTKLVQLKPDGKVELVIPLDSPPEFWRQLFDISSSHVEGSKIWKDWDTWFRQTDINENLRDYKVLPANLKKSLAVINIGRWTTYRVVLSSSQRNPGNFIKFQSIMRDHNVRVVYDPEFNFIHDCQPAVWQWIDKPHRVQETASNLHDLKSKHVWMPFEVRYLLEVCISQGKLNEYNLSKDFIDRLLALEESKAIDLLDHIANLRDRSFEPMKIFKAIVTRRASSRTKIPPYCCLIKSARITPTTVYYSPASVEVSNRVIRRYKEHADRFLRVKFTDETHIGPIHAARDQTKDQLFTRVWLAMKNGLVIGDCKYEFLAFGNSQIREQGAYFFAPLEHLNASHIRAWMGEFQHIDVIAKYSARLGQCFSTTWSVTCPKVNIQKIEDVERVGPDGKNHIFTDGVGKISPFLARLATSELRGLRHVAEPPSVYQFRLGGCKGILAVDPELGNNEIHIRPSQDKFPALSKGLEIISWSQYAPAHLNRQIILVLSALGVSDDIFMKKLLENLSNLDQAMKNSAVACRELQRIVDPNHETICLAEMVINGFQDTKEPFVISILQLWRAWRVKYIKEKANIAIAKSALLYGCVDETATLKGHFDSLQVGPEAPESAKLESLPEIFVQVSSTVEKGKYDLIEGVCLLARNPSLHPGDIRVVKAVNNPKLYHLKDVVVFPQTGDRDLAGMCSGGDLDGDDFLVIWDPDLTPTKWNHGPMDYSPPEPLRANGEVTIENVIGFFVNYMKNNRLPTIAHAHLAWADRLDEGVMSEKCTDLAALHSKAVDYNKTGVEAVMLGDQHPLLWPHFMEKSHQPAHKQYHSKKVLGQLYDHVQRVNFIPNYSSPFDERILSAFEPDANLLNFARELKVEYDQAMLQIMAQFDVKTEFEIWTTFLLAWKWGPGDYKMHEVTGRLATSLKDRFRQACYKHVGGRDFAKVAPLAVAMYKVTHEETQAALRECRQAKQVGGELIPVRKMEVESMPFMSFPWILQKELGKIRCGEYNLRGAQTNVHAKQAESSSVNDEDVEAIAMGQFLENGQPAVLQPDSPELAGIGAVFNDGLTPTKPDVSAISPVFKTNGEARVVDDSEENPNLNLNGHEGPPENPLPYDPFQSLLEAQTKDPKYGEFARRLANPVDRTSTPLTTAQSSTGSMVRSHTGSLAPSQPHSSRSTRSASLVDVSNRASGDSWVNLGQISSDYGSQMVKDNKNEMPDMLSPPTNEKKKAGQVLPSGDVSERFNTGIWASNDNSPHTPGTEDEAEEEEIVFDEDNGPNPLDLLDRMYAADL